MNCIKALVEGCDNVGWGIACKGMDSEWSIHIPANSLHRQIYDVDQQTFNEMQLLWRNKYATTSHGKNQT